MLARLAAVRRVPRLIVVPMRYNSSDGSVAQSKEFGRKERAHEEQYAHQQEIELLHKMKDQIEKKKAELDALEQQHQELEKEAKK
ncbi:hypothetical protein L208DRAFT_178208 [Tricholoma matsutake]|nr:hypothetical protein L208DRAFT_178208 [Tricholoma matsutake 945]